MTDAEVLDAVAGETGWMEDLLVALVEAPTVLGAEEEGQRVMEEAFRDCGLEPRDVPLDADALRRAEGRRRSPGTSTASATSSPTGRAGRAKRRAQR